MVLHLNSRLPRGYAAGPLIHLGSEIDVGSFKVDDYEVQIYDVKKNRRLVAAIEIVSLSNKDRPETRQVFVAKCEALLRRGVSVAIVDVVTEKNFNLHAELLELLGQRDRTFRPEPPAIYAAACRWIERGRKHVLRALRNLVSSPDHWTTFANVTLVAGGQFLPAP